MASQIQSFGGVTTPSFLIVEKVSFSVLPASQIQSLEVPYRSGAYFIDKKYGVRVFNVDVSIKAPDSYSVMYTADDLAEWLHYDEPQPLIFRDKPDITYYAIVDSSVDLTKFGQLGRGQITFLCLDPHGYKVENTYALPQVEQVTLTNNGTMPTSPKFTATFTQDTTSFSVVTSDKFVTLGSSVNVDEHIVAPAYEVIMEDNMNTTSGWTSANTYIENGVVEGSFTVSDGKFISTNYGASTTGWHGAALKKSLSESLQDFQVEFIISVSSSNVNELGRAECIMLDANNQTVCKLALKDLFKDHKENQAEMRVGDMSTGTRLINGGGKKKDDWDNFYGILRMQRVNKYWYAYVAKIDSNGKHIKSRSESFTDHNEQYMNPVTQVMVHLGQNGTNPVCNMSIDKVKVFKKNTVANNALSHIAKIGDVIEIDHNSGEILKNGEPFPESLDLSSDFFMLEKGVNNISVYPQNVADVTVTYKEKYL